MTRPDPDPIDRLDALRRSGLLEATTFAEFDRLTALAARLTGARVSLVSMVDTDRQYFTSQFGLTNVVALARETPLSQSVCSTVVAGDAALVINSMGDDQRFVGHEARATLGVEAYCGVPIRDRSGNVLGSFCVIDDDEHEWSPDAIELLEAFAEIVGDYVQTSYDHHDLVTDLQRAVLPIGSLTKESGVLNGVYRPVPDTASIGGDFYDWNLRADGTIDIIVGDVVGHGVSSTQAAAQLRSAARAVFTGSTTSPADAVRRISAACADLPGCACAAITVARITADGGRIDWVRAGMGPPILVSELSRSLDGPAGGPIGVGSWDAEHVNGVDLAPGDAIIFFTDGLVERRGEHLDVSYERAVVAASRCVDLEQLISEACPSEIQRDDVAVVEFIRR